jgi:hypothetical protein
MVYQYKETPSHGTVQFYDVLKSQQFAVGSFYTLLFSLLSFIGCGFIIYGFLENDMTWGGAGFAGCLVFAFFAYRSFDASFKGQSYFVSAEGFRAKTDAGPVRMNFEDCVGFKCVMAKKTQMIVSLQIQTEADKDAPGKTVINYLSEDGYDFHKILLDRAKDRGVRISLYAAAPSVND